MVRLLLDLVEWPYYRGEVKTVAMELGKVERRGGLKKSEKRYCTCSVLARSKEKRERIAFSFFESCKNSASCCSTAYRFHAPRVYNMRGRVSYSLYYSVRAVCGVHDLC